MSDYKPLLADVKTWIAKISKQRASPLSLSLDHLSKALKLTNENLIPNAWSPLPAVSHIYRHLAISQVELT
jgi:hypothetical protein